MTHVYTLKIRYSGEEDDVFVFATLEKASEAVYEYFEHIKSPRMSLDSFEEYLFSQDIGYFDIVKQEIK